VLERNKVMACWAFGRGALHAGGKTERRRNLLASACRTKYWMQYVFALFVRFHSKRKSNCQKK
jgi:hypothetical protein